MKIFLTGGTGFIGSHFINQAHESGHEVLALRRSPDSLPRIPLAKDPVWLDRKQEEVRAEDIAGCGIFIHLAAHSANTPYDSLEACLLHNVIHPIHLSRAVIAAGIRRFIVAGSCFEYGRAGDRYEFIPPDAPLEPTVSYPASKAAASLAFQTLAREEDLELLILRIFQVYGVGEAPTRFWPSLCKAAGEGGDFEMSIGTQIRDFIKVEDVARRLVDSIGRQDLRPGIPRIENLGSGIPMTLHGFAESEWTRLKATGKLIRGTKPLRPGEVMRIVPMLGSSGAESPGIQGQA